MPILRKPVPGVLLGQLSVMAHVPDLGNSLRLVCPAVRWAVGVGQGSHRGGGGLEQEASLHKANPHCVR